MLQILRSDIEILVGSGFIYLPLMLDLSIEREVESALDPVPALDATGRPSADLIEVDGRHYLKSISIASLLNNYEKFDPETYEYLRRGVFSKFLPAFNPGSLSIDQELPAIIFQVMPHFIRKRDKLRRKRRTDEDVLDLIRGKLNIPPRYFEEANRLCDASILRKKLRAVAGPRISAAPPFSGLIPTQSFRQWFLHALESRIVEEEKKRLGSLIHDSERFSNLQKTYVAILLYAKERGALEISGCGFFKKAAPSEYFVYVRTGEYALKDFYRRIYLFPDCRVALSTYGPLVPYVIEKYKHPFLKGYDGMQRICVRGDFVPAERFGAAEAIQALEEGLSALFHGYNSRRGNGYNRLEGMRFEQNSIVFEEYRIPSDDPRIVSGEIEVKNDFY